MSRPRGSKLWAFYSGNLGCLCPREGPPSNKKGVHLAGCARPSAQLTTIRTKKNDMLFCVECDPKAEKERTFSNVNDLEVHLIKAHFKIHIYECSECPDARFPTEFSLVHHYTSTHRSTDNFEIKYNLDHESIAIRQRIQQSLLESQCGIGRLNRSISPSIDGSASSVVVNSASQFTGAETTTAKDKQTDGFVWLDNEIAEKDLINASITEHSRINATYSTASTIPILFKSPLKRRTTATNFSNSPLSNNVAKIAKTLLPGEATDSEQNGLQLLEQISEARRQQKKTSMCQSKTDQDESGWTVDSSQYGDNIQEFVPRRSSRRSVPRIIYQEESCIKAKKRKRSRANTPVPNRVTLMSGDRLEYDTKYKTRRRQLDDRRSVPPEISNSEEKCKDRKSISKKMRASTPAPARSRSRASSTAPQISDSSSSTTNDVADMLKQFWQFIREEKYNADK
ncbi:Zinc finger putative Transcription Factor family [Ditylenchus destructor]|uniref:Zinc finger putative Transcription Factor family n=1 Tax=Ditylenchus destructor TaxID=166010 RepID=A0AAD4RCH4_9BILA|nr:Zinc finger putative Transcription Factor family [Ditylenchus destructor]